MRTQHRVLNGVVGVLLGHAAATGHPVEPGVVAPEQLLEGAPVTGSVGGQQSGVAAGGTGGNRTAVVGKTGIGHAADGNHSGTGRHFTAVDPEPGYGSAWTVISETSVRLLPAVWPSVEIHTSR